MNVAIIGCGYVAEFYGRDFQKYPELKLAGAFDRNAGNLAAFIRRWGGRSYASLAEVCADPSIELIINLTNPRDHLAVNTQCLEAGKHVYSEKPLAMTTADATALVELAERRGLMLSSAPCSLLGVTAQSLWHAIRSNAIGKIRLVYANFDDGMIAPRMAPWNWKNASGVPWPAKDEFEVGCTFEHAGYQLTWLAACFGPAAKVSAFASCQIPDKGIDVDSMAPDFTVGCIEYANNIVARVTCGLVAPRDKSLTIVGDRGTLFVGNVRNDMTSVFISGGDVSGWQSWLVANAAPVDRYLQARLQWPGLQSLFQKRYQVRGAPREAFTDMSKPVDFMRGPAEMHAALRDQRPCRLSAQLGAHIVDIVEHLQYPERFGSDTSLRTSFPPITPLDWAR